MADVTIKYKGDNIATMDASGTKTLETSGKYCEGDVQVVYVDPEKPMQSKSATPSLSTQTISPDSGKVLSSVSVAAITKELLASLDADFVAGNIKKDVDLFGLLGTFEGGGGGIEIHSGVYTPASIGTAVSNIPHGFSETPDIVIVFSPTGATSTKKSVFGFAYNITGVNSTGKYYGEYIFSYNYAANSTQVKHFDIGASSTSAFFSTDYVDSTYIHDDTDSYFRGKVYWYAIKGVN